MYAMILLCCLGCAGAHGSDPFHAYFTDEGLLIQLYQYGNAETEGFAVARLAAYPRWSGPRSALDDDGGLGAYRFRVFDSEGERILLSRGFCSLFGEWRTTEEARSGRVRVFEHALTMPFPKERILFEIAVRDRERGTFRSLLRFPVDPDKDPIHRDNPFREYRPVKIHYTGEPGSRLDLLFLGDGYGVDETQAFLDAAKAASRELLDRSPFKEHADRINCWALPTPSLDSGVDEPLKGVWRRTPFDTAFDTFAIPRYALATGIHALFEAAACGPCDLPVVLFNSPRFGGGGIYNLYAMVSGSPRRPGGVLTHEVGHALGGLADEYYTSSVSYVAFYPTGVEPWEPNITACLPGKGPKWKDLLTPGVPVPTPDRSRYAGVVGCFEGAGYQARGLFRPSRDCIMKSCRRGFCPVCARALTRALERYTR